MSTRAPDLIGLSSSLLALSSIAVALRFWTRRKQKLELKTDDWSMLLSVVCAPLPDIFSWRLSNQSIVHVPWNNISYILW